MCSGNESPGRWRVRPHKAGLLSSHSRCLQVAFYFASLAGCSRGHPVVVAAWQLDCPCLPLAYAAGEASKRTALELSPLTQLVMFLPSAAEQAAVCHSYRRYKLHGVFLPGRLSGSPSHTAPHTRVKAARFKRVRVIWPYASSNIAGLSTQNFCCWIARIGVKRLREYCGEYCTCMRRIYSESGAGAGEHGPVTQGFLKRKSRKGLCLVLPSSQTLAR